MNVIIMDLETIQICPRIVAVIDSLIGVLLLTLENLFSISVLVSGIGQFLGGRSWWSSGTLFGTDKLPIRGGGW